MFSFFKSKQSVKKTIEDIHNEFDTAGQRLLEEAKNILSGQAVTDKGERLKALGFTNAKDAAKNDEIVRYNKKVEEENKKRKESAHWVQYYAQWYPHNKFITKEIVVQICEKYNLYCGSVRQYKADVPLENIAEMEQFKLRQEDMRVETGLSRHYRMDQIDMLSNCMSGTLHHRQSLTPEEAWMLSNKKYTVKDEFEICAPEKDFDMDRMSKSGRFIIPDPIVLQPVKGGYLIVTKWGIEASDELVINHKQN